MDFSETMSKLAQFIESPSLYEPQLQPPSVDDFCFLTTISAFSTSYKDDSLFDNSAIRIHIDRYRNQLLWRISNLDELEALKSERLFTIMLFKLMCALFATVFVLSSAIDKVVGLPFAIAALIVLPNYCYSNYLFRKHAKRLICDLQLEVNCLV